MRHIGGFADCNGTQYFLAGALDFDEHGGIPAVPQRLDEGLTHPRRPRGPLGGTRAWWSTFAGVPYPELADILSALSGACVANGFGAAAHEYDSAHKLLRGLSAAAAAYGGWCVCAGGTPRLFHATAVKHRECPASAERARICALGLVPYHYAEGSPERNTAAALAGMFPGAPDELLDVVTALHTAALDTGVPG